MEAWDSLLLYGLWNNSWALVSVERSDVCRDRTWLWNPSLLLTLSIKTILTVNNFSFVLQGFPILHPSYSQPVVFNTLMCPCHQCELASAPQDPGYGRWADSGMRCGRSLVSITWNANIFQESLYWCSPKLEVHAKNWKLGKMLIQWEN